jgi:hypothetical protein
MIRNLNLFILLCALAFSGCNLNGDDCDPNLNCITFEPFEADLVVNITINADNQSVPITLYYGQYEDNDIAFQDTLESETETYIVPIDEYYSVVAEYSSGATTIYAVDGDRVSKSSQTNCNEICWTVTNGKVDLRLIP